MSSSKRSLASPSALFFAVWFGASIASAQDPGGASSSAERMRVPDGRGSATFVVASPDAALSPALRDNSDLADKAGRIPSDSPGYVVTSSVVVAT